MRGLRTCQFGSIRPNSFLLPFVDDFLDVGRTELSSQQLVANDFLDLGVVEG